MRVKQLGYRSKDSLSVRVRQSIGGDFVWEINTPDGHIVSTSQPFKTRDACAEAARQHGLQVFGISRGTPPSLHKRRQRGGWRIACDKTGVWRWAWRGVDGIPLNASKYGFLTRAECETDAQEHGYPGACVLGGG